MNKEYYIEWQGHCGKDKSITQQTLPETGEGRFLIQKQKNCLAKLNLLNILKLP